MNPGENCGFAMQPPRDPCHGCPDRTAALMSDIGDAVANAMRSRWGSLIADLCALSPRGPTSMCTCHMLQSRGPCVASNDLDPLGSALLDNAVARALGTSDHDSYRLSTHSGSSSESGSGAPARSIIDLSWCITGHMRSRCCPYYTW
jgi:hypothetical protein